MPRMMMLALVASALVFVLLRPFCEIAFASDGLGEVAGFVTAAGHPDRGDTPSGICCESIKDGTLVKPAEPLASLIQGGLLGSVFLASAGLLLFARSPVPAGKLFAVLPERSFYARSARILR